MRFFPFAPRLKIPPIKASLTIACFFLKSTWQAVSPRSALAFLLLAPLSARHSAENPIPLWPQGATGALGTAEKDFPTLTPVKLS